MGGNQSAPVSAPERLLDNHWTAFSFCEWNEDSRKQLLEFAERYWPLKDFGMCVDDVEYVNILLLGPIHAGKTSFFNTISAVFQGRISHTGRTGEESESLTLTFRKYPVFKTTDKQKLRFRLCDCRGMEDVNSVLLKDIEAMVDGHMKDGYKLNSRIPIEEGDTFYEANPKLSEKVHVVVFVIDSTNDPAMLATPEVMNQIHGVKRELNKRGIPQSVLMSKVDELKEDIRDNIELLFRYQSIKDRLNRIALNMKVAPLSVLPMCNYFEGTETRTDIDILTLYNIQQMLRMADDYLANFKTQIEKDRPLKTPWKRVCFSEEIFQNSRNEVQMFSPQVISFANVLLLGSSDSGKTDFVNSVNASIHRRFTAFDVASGQSSLQQFCKYKSIKRTDGSQLAIQFFDCAKIEDLTQLRSQVLKEIIDGKVKHGTEVTKINIEKQWMAGFLNYSQVKHKIHCVLYVIPATMTINEVKEQYSHLTETVTQSGVPQVVLLTKVDTFDSAIKTSPEKIYSNVKAKEYIERISDVMRVHIVRPMVQSISDDVSTTHSILCLNVMLEITTALGEYFDNLPEDDKYACVIC